jgi:phosphoglycerol transferase MdoB-like AlkP superfamily enzyme
MAKAFFVTSRELGTVILKALFLLAASFALACGAWFLDRLCLGVELTAYIFTYGFFVNAVPLVLLFYLLLALTNRATVSVMVTALLMVAVYFAHYQKLKFLSVPLSFSDVFLVRDMDASSIHLLSNYVNGWYLLIAVLFLAIWIGLSIVRERAFFGNRSLARLLLGVVAFSLSFGLVAGGRLAFDVYAPDKLRIVPWSPLQSILHSGLLTSIEYSNLDYGSALDVPIDQDAIKAFLDMPLSNAGAAGVDSPGAAAGDQKPDIVIIQSESFFDPAILKDIDNTEALLPNLHRALRQAVGGTMKVPTFGGGTLRTEFEVLTGIPMDAYPKIDFPYLQISTKSIPSLVGVLHADGYKAYAVHGNSGSFWNRGKAFKEMGFDRFLTKSDFPANAKQDGWFLSDQAMTDQIIGLVEKATSPTMIFAVSIEGHGPYENVPVADMAKRNAISTPAAWPPAVANEYKNYAYHISNADQQLGRLWAYLESRHRPFVLAFYGDHLPGLQHVYAVDGFDDRSDGPSEFVPWFVLSSSRTTPQSQHIFSWMLGGEVLDAAGLKRPPYYQALRRAQRLISGKLDDAEENTVMRGVESMSRLYLTGKFSQSTLSRDTPSTAGKGNSE